MKGRTLIAALLCLAVAHGQSDDPNAQLQKASGEATRGDLGAAMADVREALKLHPDFAKAWYQFGLLLGQTGDFRGAEAAFQRAIQLTPSFPEAHYNLALTFVANPPSKLDWPAAMAECRAAIAERPDYAEAINLLGAGLSATGDSRQALAEFRRALQLKPKLAEAHFNLGMTLDENGEVVEAEREFRLALQARPSYPEVSAALGKLLSRTDRNFEAEKELTKALAGNPDLAGAHYTLARVLQSLGRTKDARVEFDAAKELTQRKPNAVQSSQLSNQALETAQHGDLQGALRLLREAVALKPDYGIPHYNLGLILADTGDLAASVQELKKAISLMPGEARPWFDLGRVLHRNRDDAAAESALEWAVRLAPSEPRFRQELDALRKVADKPVAGAIHAHFAPPADTAAEHAVLAASLAAAGDPLGAVGELLRALALAPATLDARYRLAATYAQLQRTDLTVIELHNVLRISPEHVPAHLLLGQTLLKAGDAEEAIAELRVAIRLDPSCAEARAALVQAQGKQVIPAH